MDTRSKRDGSQKAKEKQPDLRNHEILFFDHFMKATKRGSSRTIKLEKVY